MIHTPEGFRYSPYPQDDYMSENGFGPGPLSTAGLGSWNLVWSLLPDVDTYLTSVPKRINPHDLGGLVREFRDMRRDNHPLYTLLFQPPTSQTLSLLQVVAIEYQLKCDLRKRLQLDKPAASRLTKNLNNNNNNVLHVDFGKRNGTVS